MMNKMLSIIVMAVVMLTSINAAEKKIIIGVSLPTQREAGWVAAKNVMEKYAKDNGIVLKMQVSDADSAQQAQQVENLLSQKIDVLILAPHDAKSAATLVEKAKQEGVPVISYDRLVLGTKALDYYITFDNFKVGALQGESIVKLAPKGNYMVFAGSPTDNNSKLFYEGAMSKLEPLIKKGDIKVINGTNQMSRSIDNWLPSNAQSMAENILTVNKNKVDAVIAPNDGTAGGIINALQTQGLKVPISGQDAEVAAVKRIRDGSQSMTIFKDANIVAVEAVKLAVKVAKKEKIETKAIVNNGAKDVPAILLEPKVVDKSNYKAVLIDSGYLKID